MTVREYVGARYVPLFSDPIEWDKTKTYEPLTIVYYQGNSYTSKTSVPTGIEITNTAYWALTGNYNAQIEAYRQEVTTYNGRITDLEDALPVDSFDENTVESVINALRTETNAAIDSVKNVLPFSAFSSSNTVDDKINALSTSTDGRLDAIESILPIDDFDSTNTVDARFDVIEAANWVATNRIANSAVTNEKIANNTIKREKLFKGNLVCLGDSIGAGWAEEQPSQTPWSSIVANKLGYSSVINKSRGGACFYSATNNFKTLAEAAVSQLGTNKNDTTMVIVAGGINDIRNNNSYSNMETACEALFNYILTQFPNAEVHIFAPLMGNRGFGDRARAVLKAVKMAFGNSTIQNRLIIHNPWTWLYDLADYADSYSFVSADHIHALQRGQYVIANSMVCEISGGTAARHNSDKMQFTNTAGTSITSTYMRSDDVVTCEVKGNHSTVSSAQFGNMLWGMDERYSPSNGTYMAFWKGPSAYPEVVDWRGGGNVWSAYQALSSAPLYGVGVFTINNDKFW